MGKIAVLDQQTIDKIAAGEVIERPSSVVKELVENAIDAGATAVAVEIRDGGISFLRVTDNGSGIEKEQVPTAFLRHATSKITRVEDLFEVSSLGFRGEALSSIAAIAMVELITKTRDADAGVRYCVEGGVEKKLEETAAPEGTTFLVRSLFSISVMLVLKSSVKPSRGPLTTVSVGGSVIARFSQFFVFTVMQSSILSKKITASPSKR